MDTEEKEIYDNVIMPLEEEKQFQVHDGSITIYCPSCGEYNECAPFDIEPGIECYFECSQCGAEFNLIVDYKIIEVGE